MFQIKLVQKIKTHILFSVKFSENPAVYEIMSKNVVEPEKPHTIGECALQMYVVEKIKTHI